MTHRNPELESLILSLGRKDILGPNPVLEKVKNIGDPAIPRLLEVLDSDDLAAAVDAINILAAIGAKQAIPKLKMLAESKWAELQQASLTALAVLDRDSASVLQLDQAHPCEQIGRLWTAIVQGRKKLYPRDVLQKYCLDAMNAMPGLAFKSNDERARAWGMMGGLVFKVQGETKPCPDAKRCYEEALKIEPNRSTWRERVREFSFFELDSTSLDDLVIDSKPASSWLKTLTDPRSYEQSSAAEALAKAGVRVVPALIEYLKSQAQLVPYRGHEGFINHHASGTLVQIGKPAVPHLKDALTDPNSKEGVWIAYLLGKLGQTDLALPLLIKHIEEKSELQFWAMSAVGGIGPQAAEKAVPALLKTLADGVEESFKDSDVAEALGEIRDRRAVEPLIELLNHSYVMVRHSAAEALGKINDKRAIEPLRATLRRETESKWPIKKALEKLEAKPQPKSKTPPLSRVEMPRVESAKPETARWAGIVSVVVGAVLFSLWGFYNDWYWGLLGFLCLFLALIIGTQQESKKRERHR